MPDVEDEEVDVNVDEAPLAITSQTPPVKKIDFEITNLDELDIDDKGQLGLF